MVVNERDVDARGKIMKGFMVFCCFFVECTFCRNWIWLALINMRNSTLCTNFATLYVKGITWIFNVYFDWWWWWVCQVVIAHGEHFSVKFHHRYNQFSKNRCKLPPVTITRIIKIHSSFSSVWPIKNYSFKSRGVVELMRAGR